MWLTAVREDKSSAAAGTNVCCCAEQVADGSTWRDRRVQKLAVRLMPVLLATDTDRNRRRPVGYFPAARGVFVDRQEQGGWFSAVLAEANC